MDTWLLTHATGVRLGAFLGVFALMAAWEVAAPRRKLRESKSIRWGNNLAIIVLNSALLRILFPAAAVGVAAFVAERGAGLLNIYAVPYPLAMVLSLLALDLAVYLQHLMFHAMPVLWRVHRMHHADLDFDVTTGARFHPLEMILSMLIKFAVILVLGPPVLAVLIFEVLLNATAMFNHSNVRIPQSWDRALRWLVVTPDMHRVHHSIDAPECNSNFGFNLPWWDRLFGTYRAQPAAGHEHMIIGIRQFRLQRDLWLDQMLLEPFRDQTGAYAINRQQEAR
ncbi:MAG: sterol desaturase family protein [Betaproteobacteria bacterium]|nr:sterol desaturase family protein [Betaproteobacteria bacterium]